MPNLGVSGTTQYEAMVQAALRHMSEARPVLDVAAIAAEVGVPRQIALGLFADGCTLLTAAAENTMVRLMDYLSTRTVQEGGSDPVAQYRAICLAYLDWAIANPVAFAVLNSRSTFMQARNGAIGRYNRATRELLTSLLERAGAANRLCEDVNVAEAVLTTRALLHGMAMLVVHRTARHWTIDDDVETAARRNVNLYLDGLFLTEPAAQPIRSEA